MPKRPRTEKEKRNRRFLGLRIGWEGTVLPGDAGLPDIPFRGNDRTTPALSVEEFYARYWSK